MEVYGTKPKLFTKEWWPYFWDYYKIHTIVCIVAAIVIISTINDCMHRTNYDLQIDVITENSVTQEALDNLTNIICENIEDVTCNGKNEAYITYIDMGENIDPQYSQAMYTKMTIEAIYTDSSVFLMSKKYADYMFENGILMPASSWTDAESYNGYAVSLENCEILENIGIDTSDLYAGVVNLRADDKEQLREKNRKKQENGVKFAKFLLDKR